ncbi:MAG: cytochrome b [Thiohalocapsa sp.]|jgi:cytochrome b561|uniref:cytochrome b n=1 Tax=Thiohalocapsa sp. TaxID=2497641 RepID=UPI0025E13795|nr:cytochrome b [Thiohalocapsa sp.]MCG6943151.1 cytochrome b [Thiohalocapsa sp.]
MSQHKPLPIRSAPVRNAAKRYPFMLIGLHWLTALLILAGVTLILAREDVSGRALRLWLLEQHRSLGLLVLALVCVRLALRWRYRARLPRHGLPRAVAVASAAGHLGLYVLLLAIPFLGWAQTSASGQDVRLFGLIRLPSLLGLDFDLADTLQGWHQVAAWSLLVLIGVHVLAALWHHLLRRDGVLTAMLPGPRSVAGARLAESALRTSSRAPAHAYRYDKR